MSKVKIFVAGAALGALAMFLNSPHSGAENRAAVSDKINSILKCPGRGDSYVEKAQKACSDFASAAAAKGQEFASTASNYIPVKQSEPAPTAADKNDELREKIEAARQRIAAQVIKNAEEAVAAVDAVAVEAETVEVAEEAEAQDAAEEN